MQRIVSYLENHRSLTLALSALLVTVVGSLPAVLGGPGSAWFRSLTKPAIFPPTWLFGIVWTVLFLLMGVAAGLIWLSDHNGRRTALALFLVQMAFNVAWTPVFFLLQNMVLGLLVIIVLWVAVVATIWRFHRIDRRAAGLLVPYLLWISFAVVLNYRFIAIN